MDYAGKTVREWPVKDQPLAKDPGLHRVGWDLMQRPEPGQEPAPGPGGRGRRGGRPAQPAAAGMYRVVLSVDGQDLTQDLRIEVDPLATPTITADEEDDEGHEAAEVKPRRIDD